jgi:hypothetical protein
MFKMNTYRLAYFILILFMVSVSCRNPSEIEILRSPDLRTPVVTGIRVTNEMGEEIAVWGYLTDPVSPVGEVGRSQNSQNDDDIYVAVPDCGLDMRAPYPNPFNGQCRISFSIGNISDVTVWIMPAVLVGEEEGILLNFGNSLLIKPGTAIAILVNEKKLPGYYQIMLDTSGLPGGFYRVFIQANQYLLWRDVAVWRKPGDLPAYLETYIYYH